ncbi:serine carboxypeptidase [Glonium stellatum]|uniref:Carboxypeptidase n=1 Tax=Glonium stellatum TaxID=574774 RepID=A0A8E2FCS8_9PEZI|nr:serine carboxypeptidase [Glonium stellatum]
MSSNIWRAALLTSCLFFGIVSTTRFQEISHRKGFSPNLRRAPQFRKERRAANETSSYRFYNNDTAPYFIDSLPDIPFDIGEMYSGLIPIDMSNASRALFFVFQPIIGEPVDEVTIWLNGGPGCSSLEGFLQETGLFIWSWGMYAPEINMYSWPNLTNVLWVEQPVGTGFSTGDVTATSEEDIAKDFVDFFLNFEKIFGISKFKIYVTGESYAGRYVPYIAGEMIDRCDEDLLDVSGALVYDPCIGSYIYAQNQAVAVPFVQQNNNVMGFNKSFLADLAALDESCGYAAFREQYMTFPPSSVQPPKYFNSTSDVACDVWGMSYTNAYAPNPCFNVYEISLQCPLLSDPLGYPTDLQYAYPGLPAYFNRTDVKQAMHAPLDVEWRDCKGPVFVGDGGPEDEGDTSPDPIQHVLPKVIEKTNRVLVANGALDFSILTNGTLLAIQNMTWNGALGFQERPAKDIVIALPDLQYQNLFVEQGFGDIDNPQGVMGVQHYERGLMWAETFLSGHMEPQFQPRSAYRHLQWVLGRIDEL